MDAFVLPLSSDQATLGQVGGKALSLAKLAAAGLPVPDGFFLTTAAYKTFVEANELQPTILGFLGASAPPGPASAELLSEQIRSLFENAAVPEEVATSIAQAYAALARDSPAVAVRSSATAEDLSDLSFAGQQDSYLNVCGAVGLRFGRPVRLAIGSEWKSTSGLWRWA